MEFLTAEQYIERHLPPGGDPIVYYPKLYADWKEYRAQQAREAKAALREVAAMAREQMRMQDPRRASTLDHLDRECSRSYRERQTVLARQSGRCEWCGKPLGEHWHLDHHIPQSRGGSRALSNLRAVCPTCNQRKGVLLPEEFALIMSLW